MSILDIKDLEIQFQTDDGCAKAVNKVNLSLEEGDTLGLVGETGAGKTTTALGIMRLISDPPGKYVHKVRHLKNRRQINNRDCPDRSKQLGRSQST